MELNLVDGGGAAEEGAEEIGIDLEVGEEGEASEDSDDGDGDEGGEEGEDGVGRCSCTRRVRPTSRSTLHRRSPHDWPRSGQRHPDQE